MAQEYNRIVCNFCLHARTCERLRTAINCPECPESLPCAQTTFFGGNACKRRMAEWRDARDAGLPSKEGECMLAEQLLVYIGTRAISEMFVPTTGYTAEELETAVPRNVSGTFGAAVVCPRCGKPTAAIERTYDWSPHIALVGRSLTNNATLKCMFCDLDGSHTYE